MAPSPAAKKNHHGFVAGVFSGIAKLSGMFSGSVTACLALSLSGRLTNTSVSIQLVIRMCISVAILELL